MTDDIVTRLREELDGPAMTVTRQDVRDVLAEIERLQAEIARLGSFLYPINVVINTNRGKNFDSEKIAETITNALLPNKAKKAEVVQTRKALRKRIFDVVHGVVMQRGDEPYADEGDAWVYYANPDTSCFLPELLADALTDELVLFIEKEIRYE